jgi:1,4-dihydroxy-2-naphthoate octaprenyltransferase
VLPITATYYILTGSFDAQIFLASIPVSMLIIAVLYINQYPDIEADVYAGKRNLVVRMGAKRARFVYYLLMVTTYISIALLVTAEILPLFSLFAMATVPLTIKTSLIFHRNYDKPKKVFPAMKLTILNHHLTGLILTGSLFLD